MDSSSSKSSVLNTVTNMHIRYKNLAVLPSKENSTLIPFIGVSEYYDLRHVLLNFCQEYSILPTLALEVSCLLFIDMSS